MPGLVHILDIIALADGDIMLVGNVDVIWVILMRCTTLVGF